jgi:uncharacterized protein YueI
LLRFNNLEDLLRIGLFKNSIIHPHKHWWIQFNRKKVVLAITTVETAQVRKGVVKELTHYQDKDQRHFVIILKLNIITLKLNIVTLKLNIITRKLSIVTLKLNIVTLKLNIVTLKLEKYSFLKLIYIML